MKKINSDKFGWSQAYPYPPFHDILTGSDRQWAHSPVFLQDPTTTINNSPTANGFFCTQAILIPMTGSRRTDRINVINQFGGNLQAWGAFDLHHTYTFHMIENIPHCYAQMVLRTDHNWSKPHLGAVSQYAHYYNTRYRAIRNEEMCLEDNFNDDLELSVCPEKLSESDLEQFEEKHGVEIPEWLRKVYRDNEEFPKCFSLNNEYIEVVQAYAPLLAKNVYDCSVEFLLTLPYFCEKLAELGSKAFPFAFDPCGNVYIAAGKDVWFLDDECDELIPAKVNK